MEQVEGFLFESARKLILEYKHRRMLLNQMRKARDNSERPRMKNFLRDVVQKGNVLEKE